MNSGNEKPSALARTLWHQVVRLCEDVRRALILCHLNAWRVALDGLGADADHRRTE